jgi:hypothetical protein
VFARGGAGTGDQAWLAAMLHTGAAPLGHPGLRRRPDAAGVTQARAGAALDPAGYPGAAGEFVDAALAAHRAAAG